MDILFDGRIEKEFIFSSLPSFKGRNEIRQWRRKATVSAFCAFPFNDFCVCTIFQLSIQFVFSVRSAVCLMAEKNQAQSFFLVVCIKLLFVWFGASCQWILTLRDPLYGVINVFVGICVYDLVSFQLVFFSPQNSSKISINFMNLFMLPGISTTPV